MYSFYFLHFAYIHVYVPRVCSAHKGQVSDPIVPEIKKTEPPDTGARNQTWVPGKSRLLNIGPFLQPLLWFLLSRITLMTIVKILGNLSLLWDLFSRCLKWKCSHLSPTWKKCAVAIIPLHTFSCWVSMLALASCPLHSFLLSHMNTVTSVTENFKFLACNFLICEISKTLNEDTEIGCVTFCVHKPCLARKFNWVQGARSWR